MANRFRGEIDSDLFGKPMTFCLTLGALAEIESEFQSSSVSALLARLARGDIAAHDLIVILGAAARAGGCACSNHELASYPLHGGLEQAMTLAGDLLLACFDDPDRVEPISE